ncbi:flavin reductase family protein [Porticoccus sp. W117]|uniref:flavin reductase family protein n=1 Tax=Porticoccus sp. W117 TaxID=3054777 RepID=UPI0025951BD2|nr:flavin reductase family protein [Porticoccus sp. W117]MDM3872189.1 flavin reductase family protein [Porticoccus sp. W117]
MIAKHPFYSESATQDTLAKKPPDTIMYLHFDQLSPSQRYFTMTQSILPRPIAWVLSDNGDGSHNLAPFSYFNAVCSDPPLIMLSIGHKPDGSRKDTLVNIREREHFVVHIPHSKQAAQVTESSRTLEHGVSELDSLDMALTEFEGFNLPRLAECRLAFACQRYQIQELGNGPQFLVLGEIKQLYASDDVATVNDSGRLTLDANAIDPLARLGSSEYGTLGKVIDVPRPK